MTTQFHPPSSNALKDKVVVLTGVRIVCDTIIR